MGKVRENFFKKSREPQNRKTREKQGQGSVVQKETNITFERDVGCNVCRGVLVSGEMGTL